MDHARILDRSDDSMLLIAPILPASRARPRLLALYRDQLSKLPAASHGAFLTGRAMATRGMRIMGLPARALSAPDLRPDLSFAVSHDGSQVAVWLRRPGQYSLGLDLREIGDDPVSQPLTAAEALILSQQPGLARMRPDEYRAGAISAKHALTRALEAWIGDFGGPSVFEVRPSRRSGIALGYTDATVLGFKAEDTHHVELRVMSGCVLTRIAVSAPVRRRLC